MRDMPKSGPLGDIRVLAFEHAWSGPYGTMMLADMGADVVKIEQPGTGDHVRNWTRNDLEGLSPHFLSANRNKRSLCLDLKSAQGQEIARDLVSKADIVLENFSPGVMKRLGLDYETLRTDNERLIYCSVNGFGSEGPFAGRRAYDLLVQSEGGLVAVTGENEDNLAKVGVPVVDIMAAMVAAFSCVCALMERGSSGLGRHIDISMLEVAVSSMSFNLFSHGISGVEPVPMGTAHPLLAPYEVYEAAAGERVAIGILTEAHWHAFCDLIGRGDLAHDISYSTAPMRVENRSRLNHELRPEVRKHSADEWISMMTGVGLACAKVNQVPDLLSHPQLAYRNFLESWAVGSSTLTAPGAPWYAPHDAPVARTLPPARGQDSASVLEDWLSINQAAVEALFDAGVVEDSARVASRVDE